ncbi:hypothetical protein CKA32_002756 [Geitlerinema sp. FC II]|nr:hypothetical protein CKA32_002756 [Geitlerinema sp. FC II]
MVERRSQRHKRGEPQSVPDGARFGRILNVAFLQNPFPMVLSVELRQTR